MKKICKYRKSSDMSKKRIQHVYIEKHVNSSESRLMKKKDTQIVIVSIFIGIIFCDQNFDFIGINLQKHSMESIQIFDMML